jgi:hypothetical protein
MRYGDRWRGGRKLLHSHVHVEVASKYHPIQLASARRLARDILRSKTTPEALPRAVKSNFGRSIMKMVYGIEVRDDEDDYLSLAEKVLEEINEASTPGRFLVDFLPIREYRIRTDLSVTDKRYSEARPSMVPGRWLPAIR